MSEERPANKPPRDREDVQAQKPPRPEGGRLTMVQMAQRGAEANAQKVVGVLE